MNGQIVIREQFEAGDFSTLEKDRILRCLELQIVGDAYRGHHVPQIGSHLTPDCRNSAKQRRVLPALDHPHQTEAHLHGEWFYAQ